MARISVRFNADIEKLLKRKAVTQGLPVSIYARQLIMSGLSQQPFVTALSSLEPSLKIDRITLQMVIETLFLVRYLTAAQDETILKQANQKTNETFKEIIKTLDNHSAE